MNEERGIRLEVAALMVAVAALAAYALTLANGFAYDDIPVLLGDPRLGAFRSAAASSPAATGRTPTSGFTVRSPR